MNTGIMICSLLILSYVTTIANLFILVSIADNDYSIRSFYRFYSPASAAGEFTQDKDYE